MQVRFVTPDGKEMVVDGAEGETALQCAKRHSVPGIIGECGGSMACATCHGYVDDRWADKLAEADELELGMLSGCIDVRDGSPDRSFPSCTGGNPPGW